jgi:hypothetical protein
MMNKFLNDYAFLSAMPKKLTQEQWAAREHSSIWQLGKIQGIFTINHSSSTEGLAVWNRFLA